MEQRYGSVGVMIAVKGSIVDRVRRTVRHGVKRGLRRREPHAGGEQFGVLVLGQHCRRE